MVALIRPVTVDSLVCLRGYENVSGGDVMVMVGLMVGNGEFCATGGGGLKEMRWW